MLEAYYETIQLTYQVKEAILGAERFIWQYKDSQSGEMRDFSLLTNNELEKAYKVWRFVTLTLFSDISGNNFCFS